MARSASSAATRPISGRLTRSRSPPQPKTQITRPSVSARRRQHVSERVGSMRIVHEDGEGLALVDRLEAPWHALERLHAGCDLVVLQVEQPPGRHRPEHVLDVEATAESPSAARCRRP